MKIYTKTGDGGETSLLGGDRVPKDDARVEAYGTVDELNALIGAVRSLSPDPDLDRHLSRVQGELFSLGAELASPRESRGRRSVPDVGAAGVEELEQAIDRWEEELPPLHAFVLPAGARIACALHVARAAGRRAERRVVALGRTAEIDPRILTYLNRLSDFLFVAARTANRRAGVPDVPWHPPSPGSGS